MHRSPLDSARCVRCDGGRRGDWRASAVAVPCRAIRTLDAVDAGRRCSARERRHRHGGAEARTEVSFGRGRAPRGGRTNRSGARPAARWLHGRPRLGQRRRRGRHVFGHLPRRSADGRRPRAAPDASVTISATIYPGRPRLRDRILARAGGWESGDVVLDDDSLDITFEKAYPAVSVNGARRIPKASVTLSATVYPDDGLTAINYDVDITLE